MKTEINKKKTISSANAPDVRVTILSDLLNVTWRMVVPTLLGIAIGMGADRLFASSPAGFLIGAVLGFAAGLYLAMRLLKKAREAEV